MPSPANAQACAGRLVRWGVTPLARLGRPVETAQDLIDRSSAPRMRSQWDSRSGFICLHQELPFCKVGSRHVGLSYFAAKGTRAGSTSRGSDLDQRCTPLQRCIATLHCSQKVWSCSLPLTGPTRLADIGLPHHSLAWVSLR